MFLTLPVRIVAMYQLIKHDQRASRPSPLITPVSVVVCVFDYRNQRRLDYLWFHVSWLGLLAHDNNAESHSPMVV